MKCNVQCDVDLTPDMLAQLVAQLDTRGQHDFWARVTDSIRYASDEDVEQLKTAFAKATAAAAAVQAERRLAYSNSFTKARNALRLEVKELARECGTMESIADDLRKERDLARDNYTAALAEATSLRQQLAEVQPVLEAVVHYWDPGVMLIDMRDDSKTMQTYSDAQRSKRAKAKSAKVPS